MSLGKITDDNFTKALSERLDEMSGQIAALKALVMVLPAITPDDINKAQALLSAHNDIALDSARGISGEVGRRGAAFLEHVRSKRAKAQGS